jgi:ABC-type lipoprotein export system ATPase subunit
MILEVVNLKFSYETRSRKTPVLMGINFGISVGEFVAMVGPSGSGKTTLLHCVAGLLRPEQGIIRVLNREIAAISSREVAVTRRRWMGMAFQSPHLLPQFTALDNVAVPLMLDGASRKSSRNRARHALSAVVLESREDHFPYELSAGEQQRVALARAIVHEPSVLLADEPTGNLDEETTVTICDLLNELRTRLSLAILVATHDPVVAERCERSLVLSNGVVRSEDPARGHSETSNRT